MSRHTFKYLLLAGTLLGTAPHALASNLLEEALTTYKASSGKHLDAEDISEKLKGFVLSLLSQKSSLVYLNKVTLEALESEKSKNSLLLKQTQDLASEKEVLRLQLEDATTTGIPVSTSIPTSTPLSDMSDDSELGCDCQETLEELSHELEEREQEKKVLSQDLNALKERFRQAQEDHERQLALHAHELSEAKDEHEKQIALRAAELSAIKEDHEKKIALTAEEFSSTKEELERQIAIRVSELSATKEEHERQLALRAAELSQVQEGHAHKLAALQDTMRKEIIFRHQCYEELSVLIPAATPPSKKPSNEFGRFGAELGRWGRQASQIGQALSERDGGKIPSSTPPSHLPTYLQAFLKVPLDFEVYRYLGMQSDVSKVAHEQTEMSPEKFALIHYAFSGIKEGRLYK